MHSKFDRNIDQKAVYSTRGYSILLVKHFDNKGKDWVKEVNGNNKMTKNFINLLQVPLKSTLLKRPHI